jgi:hypothetical protein
MWDLQTTIERNEKEAAENIARLAEMFNKRSKPRKRRLGIVMGNMAKRLNSRRIMMHRAKRENK